MAGLFQRNVKTCIRDHGEPVRIVDMPFKTVYSNVESRRLSEEYEVHSHPGFVPSSLGSSGLESFVGQLFRAYSFIEEFCGFFQEEFKDFARQTCGRPDYLDRLFRQGFLKEEMIMGLYILFPTENLLVNQKMKKRNSEN